MYGMEKLDHGYSTVKQIWRYVCFDGIHERDRRTDTDNGIGRTYA